MEDNEQRKRPVRVASRIREEISRMLLKGLKDPRLEMVSIRRALRTALLL